jgi:hypothetical protein
MVVWVGAYTGNKDLLTVMPRHIWSPDRSEASPIAYCVTFTVFRLVFQVLVPMSPGSLAPLESFGGSVMQSLPFETHARRWPPPFSFDPDSIQALAVRVNDGRGSVQMTVAMNATGVVRPS